MRNLLLLTFTLLLFSSCQSQDINEFVPVRIDGNNYVFINNNGEIVISEKFRKASPFSMGLAKVQVNKKYGFINTKGKFVIEPIYRNASSFNNNLAIVRENYGGKETYITKEGKIIENFFDNIYGCKEGLCRVYKRGIGYGYVNDKGELIIEPQFDDAGEFNNGLAFIKKNGLFGFINKKGKIIIKPIYNLAYDFSNELALIRIDGNMGFINKKGQLVIQSKFKRIFSFSDGLARFGKNNKFGFINTDGDVVIEPKLNFTYVENFSDGLARFNIDIKREGKVPIHKYGFIDKQGNIVIKPKFPFASDFKNGLALVRDKKTGYHLYINKKGEYIYYPKTDN